jgi:hypothetical protein
VKSRRLIAAVGALAGGWLLSIPAGASAHGISAKADLPIPAWLFAWAATIVLLVSFAALAVLWQKPKLAFTGERDLFRLGSWTDVVLGTVGVVWFGLVVWAGLTGTFVATANLAPTAVWVLFWVGMPIASALFGDVFRLLSPWRATARAVGWVLTRVISDGLPEPKQWPVRLGRLPAAIGLLAMGWLELASVSRDDPSVLATLALAYAAIQLLGMSAFGVEQWSVRGDSFGVAFSLISKIAPFERVNGVLRMRVPLSGLARLQEVPWTQAVLLVLIGTTSFDGFTQGPIWADGSQTMINWFNGTLGIGTTEAAQGASTIGLLGGIGLVSAIWLAGVHFSARDLGQPTREVGRAFVQVLVPIALAYTVAHYASFFLVQGQALFYLVSDPAGTGADWFGTAQVAVDYGVISPNGVWWVQVAALVAGHVCALVLAHDRALEMADDQTVATRSQIPMLIATVAFTTLGLWLLSAANL